MQNTVKRMSWLTSTIGQKQLIAITGLGLSLFVLTHMAGNMLILVSAQKYNEYGHALISNPAIYLAEAGLIAMFVAHLAFAIRLTWLNKRARGDTSYAVLSHGDKGTSWIQRTLIVQGLLIAFFLVLHLIAFKFGVYHGVDYGQGEIRDLHRLAVDLFQQPLYVIWYILCLLVLGLHLSHGVSSSLQTAGFHHPRYQGKVKVASWIYALVVTFGFISQPLYIFFIYRGQ